jgi:4-diphosphocytidyl-2-C-methyl-D-erythritol kinase
MSLLYHWWNGDRNWASDQLSALSSLDHLHVVLGKYRSLNVSTAWAYQTYRQQFSSSYVANTPLESRAHIVHSGPIVKAISQKDRCKSVNCSIMI